MTHKFKNGNIIREQIIAKNDRTIRAQVDSLSMLPSETLQNGFKGYAASDTTHPCFALQAMSHEITTLLDGCEYRLPNKYSGEYGDGIRLQSTKIINGESGAGKGTIFEGSGKTMLRTQKRNQLFIDNNNFASCLSPDFDEKVYYFERPDIWRTKDEIDISWNLDAFYKFWDDRKITNKFEISGNNRAALQESIIRHNGSGSIIVYEFGNFTHSFKVGSGNAITVLCELSDPVLSGCSTRKKNGCNIPKIIGNRSNLFASCTLETYAQFMYEGAAQGTGGRVVSIFCHKARNDPLRASLSSVKQEYIPNNDLKVSRRFQLWRDQHFYQRQIGADWQIKVKPPSWKFPNEVPLNMREKSMSVYARKYMEDNQCDFDSVKYPSSWYDKETQQLKLQFMAPLDFAIRYQYLENWKMNQDYKAVVNRANSRFCNSSIAMGFALDMFSINDPRKTIKWNDPFRKEACDNGFSWGTVCDRSSFQVLSTCHEILTSSEQENNDKLNESWKWRKCPSVDQKTKSKIIEAITGWPQPTITSSDIRTKAYNVKEHGGHKYDLLGAIQETAWKLKEKSFVDIIEERNLKIPLIASSNNKTKKVRGGGRKYKGYYGKNKLTEIWAHKTDKEIIEDVEFMQNHRVSMGSYCFPFGNTELQVAKDLYNKAIANYRNEMKEDCSDDLINDNNNTSKCEWQCKTCSMDNSFWKQQCGLCGQPQPNIMETKKNSNKKCEFLANNSNNNNTNNISSNYMEIEEQNHVLMDDINQNNNNKALMNNKNIIELSNTMNIDQQNDVCMENIDNDMSSNNIDVNVSNNNLDINMTDNHVNNDMDKQNDIYMDNTDNDASSNNIDINLANNNMNNNFNKNLDINMTENNVNIDEWRNAKLQELKQHLFHRKVQNSMQILNNKIAITLSRDNNKKSKQQPFIIQNNKISVTKNDDDIFMKHSYNECANNDEKDQLLDRIINDISSERNPSSVSTTVPLPGSDDEPDNINQDNILFLSLINDLTPIEEFINKLSKNVKDIFPKNYNFLNVGDLAKSDTETFKLHLAQNKLKIKGASAVIEGIENEYNQILQQLHSLNNK